jgi:uncharacterized protein YhaN
MSPIETQDILSEDIEGTSDTDGSKLVRHTDGGLVPVTESIRYRKRAQSAEKKLEVLTEQLAQAKAQSEKMSEQLSALQAEQKLTHKLAAAGAVDLETATLIAKARMQNQDDADVDGVVEQLKKEKHYLFGSSGGSVTPGKTAGVRDRVAGNQTLLERAAKKAATTGNRTDLHEYLKLRRNFL